LKLSNRLKGQGFKWRYWALGLALLMVGCPGGGSSNSPGEEIFEEEEPLIVFDRAAPTIDGLVAFYPFAGDGSDHSGKNNHGNIMGPELTRDRFGRKDHAYQFDGVDDYMVLSDRAVDDSLKDFTVSLWFKTGSGGKKEEEFPSGKRALYFEALSGGPGLWIRMVAGQDKIVASAKNEFSVETVSAFNDGRWHHLVVTAEQGWRVRIYVDGALAAESEAGLEFFADEPTPAVPVIGRTGEAGSTETRHFFDGALDDISIFQRGLGEDEITFLWDEGPNRLPVANGGENQTVFELNADFDGSDSYDPDGQIVETRWNFNDGSPPSFAVAPSHEFSNHGTYDVTLTVIDDEGGESTDLIVVEVFDPNCVTIDCMGRGAWDPAWADKEVEMLHEVNEWRAKGADCGGDEFPPTTPLEMNPYLRRAARLHSLDMAVRDFFDHENPDGEGPWDRIEATGYPGAAPWGENIQGGSESAEDAVLSLIDSPGHCRNIMDPSYHVVGFGYVFLAGSSLAHYWTQVFGGSH